MTNIGCGARPACTSSASCSVSRTWLSSTARRWALNSSPSRGTLPCTAATVIDGSSPAPGTGMPDVRPRQRGRAAARALMQTPGSTTAGGAARVGLSSLRRHHLTISNVIAAKAESDQHDRERQQRRTAELGQRQQRAVGLTETDYPQGNPPNGHGRLEPLLGRPQRRRTRTASRAAARTATAASPNSAGNSACNDARAPATGMRPTRPLIHGSSGR